MIWTGIKNGVFRYIMGKFYFIISLFHIVQQTSDNTQESQRNLCAEQGRFYIFFNLCLFFGLSIADLVTQLLNSFLYFSHLIFIILIFLQKQLGIKWQKILRYFHQKCVIFAFLPDKKHVFKITTHRANNWYLYNYFNFSIYILDHFRHRLKYLYLFCN